MIKIPQKESVNLGECSTRFGGREMGNKRLGQSHVLFVLIPIVCVAVAYTHWPALHARAFCFDDDQYLTQNALVQTPSWDSTASFFSEILEPSTVGGYYQPLSMITLMIDFALGGHPNNLLPFHRTSLLLHVANVALIILLLYLLLGDPWAAAIAGLLFGVHPMTVEVIAWVGERKTTLATFFALVTLVSYVHYARTRGRRYWGIAFAAYALALLSKPTATPLPFAMLILDFWPLRSAGRRIFLEKIPFFVVGGLSAAVTIISQARTGGMSLPMEYGVLRIPLVLCHNIVFYLNKMVWPHPLSSHYAFPDPLSLSHPKVLIGVIGTFLLLVAIIISWRWTRALAVGCLIFFVLSLPTMQIIEFSNVIASDKFAYLPCCGLLITLVAGLRVLLMRRSNYDWLWRNTSIAIAIVLASMFAGKTQTYLKKWRSTVSLYEHMLMVTPNAHPLYTNLGVALAKRGHLIAAARRFSRALELAPDLPEANNNMANVLLELGRFDEAFKHYTAALEIASADPILHKNIARVCLLREDQDAAIFHYTEAVRFDPMDAEAQYGLGTVKLAKGMLRQAIQHLENAVMLDEEHVSARSNLAVALAQEGNLEVALHHFLEAERQGGGHETIEGAVWRFRLPDSVGRARNQLRANDMDEIIDKKPTNLHQ